MADPVLRIPIDDAAFKRYMEAFERYQSQLREQPNMWAEANAEVLDGVSANLALADAIGASVSAAMRLGDAQNRNAQMRKREAENSEAEEQRASGWRRKALDHVQELNRSAGTVVRSFSTLAAGSGGSGGLFGMLANNKLGGEIGEIASIVGKVVNAGYDINNAVSDKGLFARGIGATLGQQEGFHNNLGRYTNTDQGLDAVMNARGTPQEWWKFNALGVDRTKGSNADVYGNVLRSQAELAKRYTDKNGVTNWAQVDPRGGSAFGTTHEDLNRLKGLSGADLDKAIRDAVSFKTPLQDKQIDAATKTVIAMDNNTQKITDLAQAMTTQLNPAMDKLTQGIDSLTDIAGKIYDLLSFNWFGDPTVPDKNKKPGEPGNKDQSWLGWAAGGLDNLLTWGANGLGKAIGLTDEQLGIKPQSGGAAPQRRGAPAAANNNGAASMGDVTGVARSMGWRVTSGTRSYAEQKSLYDAWRANPSAYPRGYVVAKPGHSAHESGRAMDIGYGKGVTLAGIVAELRKRGVNVTRAINEGNHYHVEWGAPGAAGRNRRVSGGAGNVNVNVKVSAPPGHQTAVTSNSASMGGAKGTF